MNVYFLFFPYLLILSFLSPDPSALLAIDSEKMGFIQIAKNEKRGSQEESKSEADRAIEAYEREKLAKFKRNIGKRYLVVRTVRPVEFQHSPEEPKNTFSIQKEKEGFLITEVIQNHSGAIYFYQVVFDSGQTGYLMAEGNHLQIKTLEGSIIPLTRKARAKGKSLGSPKGPASQAVALVKNHLIKIDPMTGQRMTVELRMTETKARFFPNLKWRYEAREIGNNRCRVIQYSEGEENSSLLRTWIIDLSTQTVHPENMSAKNLYR